MPLSQIEKDQEEKVCVCIDIDCGMKIMTCMFCIDIVVYAISGFTTGSVLGIYYQICSLINAIPIGYMLYWAYQQYQKEDTL